MIRTRWQIFRMFGIPFFVDFSWIIILALLVWTLTGLFRRDLPGRDWFTYLAMGGVEAAGFFLCILLHEIGHAFVAQRSGTPVRSITMFLFGGVAELDGEPPSAGHEFATAIAGPVITVALAAICSAAAVLAAAANFNAEIVLVLEYLAGINLMVLVFNAVPAFPLDGGRVLRAILWGATGQLSRATYWSSLAGQIFAWTLMAFGLGEFILGDYFNGVWLGLLGVFLRSAAQGSYQNVAITQALAGQPVRRFMNSEPIVVAPTLDLLHWVNDYVYRHHRKSFPVVANGHLEGFVTTSDLRKCPREYWGRHTVGEFMHKDVTSLSIAPNAAALEALRKMQRIGSPRLLVIDHEQLLGTVTQKDIGRFIRMKSKEDARKHRDTYSLS